MLSHLCHCSSRPQCRGWRRAPGNHVRGKRQINTRFTCAALGRQAGCPFHRWKHMLQHHEQPRVPRLQQRKPAEHPAPLGRHQGAPWDPPPPALPGAPWSCQTGAQPGHLPQPTLSIPQWVPVLLLPSASAPSTAIWSAGWRHPKENSPCQEERAGELGSRGAGELSAWLTGWSQAGQHGKQQEIWARVARAAAGLGGARQMAMQERGTETKTEAKGTANGGEEMGHGQDWPPHAPHQETRFTPALLLTPWPASTREGRGLQRLCQPSQGRRPLLPRSDQQRACCQAHQPRSPAQSSCQAPRTAHQCRDHRN